MTARLYLTDLFQPCTHIVCNCGTTLELVSASTDGHGGDIVSDGVHGTAGAEYRCPRCNIAANVAVYA